MNGQRAVDVAFDPASESAFEQLPSQRYPPLDVKIAFIEPASDFETLPGDRRRMAILGPGEPVDPAGVTVSGLKERRPESRLRDFRRLTMLNGDIETSHPIPPPGPAELAS